jgi:formyltetrahydrofolate synthetase
VIPMDEFNLHLTGDIHAITGKSFSEALILASINPQYDKRLFIELQVQYMKIASSEHVVYIYCSERQNKKQFLYITCSELGIFVYRTCNSMNNLSSYCGLVDAKRKNF